MWSKRCRERGGLLRPALTTADDAARRGTAGPAWRSRRRGAAATSDGLRTTVLPAASAADQRREQQLDRVVPRGDHQGHAQWFWGDPCLPRAHDGGQPHRTRADPAVEVLEDGGDLPDREAEVSGVALDRGLAEISGQRIQQPTLLLVQHPAQLVELGLAGRHVPQQALVEAGPYGLDHLRGAGNGGRCGSCGGHRPRLRAPTSPHLDDGPPACVSRRGGGAHFSLTRTALSAPWCVARGR